MKAFAWLGKVLLFLASCALIAGISLFVVGAYLTTWPIMRLSPRAARTQSLVNIAVDLMALARAYGLDQKLPVSEQEDAGEVTPKSA